MEEKRRAQGKKLQQIMQEKRNKITQQNQERLVDYKSLMSAHSEDTNIKKELKQRGMKTVEDLEHEIKKLEIKLGIATKSDEDKFNLLDRDDAELTTDELKKKRMQKAQFKLQEARQKKQNLQKEEQKRIAALTSEERNDYVKKLYEQRCELLDGIAKRKVEREQRLKRGGTAAKKRLKQMAGMINANEDDAPVYHNGSDHDDSEGEFGLNDDDWDVYR